MTNNSLPPEGSRAPVGPALLTIGEVAARTGLPETLLRTWESRYGVPRPERSENGRRRYRVSDCDLLQEVQRWRATGLSVGAAIAQAQRAAVPVDSSVFATTRRRHPSVAVHRLRKPALLALSRAIEDQCCAGAQRPLLIAAFQRPEFYEAARRRWLDLARTAALTVVLAAFPSSAAPRRGGPALVKLPADAAMLREWVVLCYAPDQAALLSGWELPGQDATPDRERRFEVLWSVEPQVVRDAALAASSLLAGPERGLSEQVASLLGDGAPPTSEDLLRGSALLDRALDYLWQ